MTRYRVTVPITAYAYVEVEADNEEEAVDIALELDIRYDDIEEMSFHRDIVIGNVFMGLINSVEIDKLDGDDILE